MKLIDTNVFVYSLGSDHPYREPSLATLKRIRESEINANISTEILQELLHVYRRRNQLQLGIELFDDLVGQFPQPLPIVAATAIIARDVLEQYPSLQVRDAFHAAVVFEHNLEGIISADRAFDSIEGLTRFDPKELAA